MDVLASRETGSITDAWHEFLCLERLSDGAVRLSVRGYEFAAVLDEVCPADEETGERDVPDAIGGEAVHQEFGYLVYSNRLVPVDDEAVFTLTPGHLHEARVWLEERGWDRHPDFAALWASIQEALRRGG